MKAIFFLLLLTSQAAISQDLYPLTVRMVISINGVNVREKPNRNAKVVLTLKYGEFVTLLNENGAPDTIGTTLQFGYRERSTVEKITGKWVRISYKGLTGFSFDSFLCYPEKQTVAGINDDYVLLFPYCTCYFNYPKSSYQYWYGIYKVDSTHFRVTKIVPQFWAKHDEVISPLCISTNKIDSLLFIVGANQELSQRIITGGYQADCYNANINSSKYINNGFFHDLEAVQLSYCYNGIEQIISAVDITRETHPSCILWRGDIDGDQKDDFIVDFGEKYGQSILFISCDAEKGNLLKAVACYYSGYCC